MKKLRRSISTRTLPHFLFFTVALMLTACSAQNKATPQSSNFSNNTPAPNNTPANTNDSEKPTHTIAVLGVELEVKNDFWRSRFINAITSSETPIIRCASVKEVPDTYLCGGNDQEKMIRTFLRASIHSEGKKGTQKGAVIINSDLQFDSRDFSGIAGFNLHTSTLYDFYEAVELKCQKDQDFCPSPSEKPFFNWIKALKTTPEKQFSIVTFTTKLRGKDYTKYDKTINHELLHAQFMSDRRYEEVVRNFYLSLETNERETFLKRLSAYDANDTDITNPKFMVINEFYAYVMTPISYPDTHGISDSRRAQLEQLLIAVGLKIFGYENPKELRRQTHQNTAPSATTESFHSMCNLPVNTPPPPTQGYYTGAKLKNFLYECQPLGGHSNLVASNPIIRFLDTELENGKPNLCFNEVVGNQKIQKGYPLTYVSGTQPAGILSQLSVTETNSPYRTFLIQNSSAIGSGPILWIAGSNPPIKEQWTCTRLDYKVSKSKP